jgi:T4-like virus tail tube protein gp19
MARDYLAERARGFRYLVELDGVPRAAFGYCAGLEEAGRPVEYYIGDDEIDLRDVAHEGHSTSLLLAQGVAFDDTLEAWQRAVAEGSPEKHEGAIIEFDGRGHACRSYHFSGAKPAFFQTVYALGSRNDRHIDTLEIAYDNLRKG